MGALHARAADRGRPGIRAGECERVVELLDIYPTLMDLAGLPASDELDGKSLRPLLDDPGARWDGPAITSRAFNMHSVRTERWRYSTYPDGEELYDHWHDPNEWHNLASEPEYADIKGGLAELLPRNPSRKKVAQWSDLSAARRTWSNSRGSVPRLRRQQRRGLADGPVTSPSASWLAILDFETGSGLSLENRALT